MLSKVRNSDKPRVVKYLMKQQAMPADDPL